ncbi:chemotaxis protein CheB [uncultured Sphingomonas sp.]|uniref:chemotaxis protein CheB n=1 Tax=uncultured Sphingomonas sp. TaxID=158754 RepID=UPI00260405A9|nr:chemotaxis protein CheB [uncultured Sphingomonas sp.]
MSAARIEAIVIGASAGAVEALSAILPRLPADYQLPVIVVVHVPADRRNVMAPLFQSKCRVAVREAEDKELVVGGTVYFAPPDYHLLVEVDRTLSLSADEPVLYSRPSIDVLFESAAEAYGPALAGVVLTGANQDGARGLAAVEAAGGIALVEDPASACSSAMPLAALNECRAARALSIDAIAHCLLDLGGV